MTKPLTERLRELQRKGYGPVGLAQTCGEAAKALEEARWALTDAKVVLTNYMDLQYANRVFSAIARIDTFLAAHPETRESQPEAKRTTPRSN